MSKLCLSIQIAPSIKFRQMKVPSNTKLSQLELPKQIQVSIAIDYQVLYSHIGRTRRELHINPISRVNQPRNH